MRMLLTGTTAHNPTTRECAISVTRKKDVYYPRDDVRAQLHITMPEATWSPYVFSGETIELRPVFPA